MKKALTVLLLAVVVAAAAAPALAQVRDPFNPSEQSQNDQQGDNQQDDGGGSQPFEPQDQQGSDNEVEPVQSSTDALPTTGGDPEFWLVISFGLLAIGGAFVLLHRLGAPVPVHRRKRR